jgi:nucleoside-diphosphate-sugar epimerase
MVHVLITGGVGFIGAQAADAILHRGDQVRVLDTLDPQLHGVTRPEYLRIEETAGLAFNSSGGPAPAGDRARLAVKAS